MTTKRCVGDGFGSGLVVVWVIVALGAVGCAKKQGSGSGKAEEDSPRPAAKKQRRPMEPAEQTTARVPSSPRGTTLPDLGGALPDVEVKDVRCERQAKEFPGADGARMVATCPAGCADVGSVWGTDVYTDDSSLCRALLHAGVVGREGGRALVTFTRGQLAYRGSLRHGIQSSAYGQWELSFYAQRLGPDGKPQGRPPRVTGTSSATLDCTHAADVLPGPAGKSYRVSCPRNCKAGSVWGTNPYTADSAICRAAIHAGVSTAQGGRFTVTIAPGQEKYAGSEKNGITSESFGSYDRSYGLFATSPAKGVAPAGKPGDADEPDEP